MLLLKEKQNTANKLLLTETKFEATSSENTILKQTFEALNQEIGRNAEEITALKGKLKEGVAPLQVQTIIKDNSTTKQ